MSEKDRMSPEAYQNKKKYNVNYSKENYKKFSASLPIKEVDEITKHLNTIKMNKTEFIRWAYDKLKNTK